MLAEITEEEARRKLEAEQQAEWKVERDGPQHSLNETPRRKKQIAVMPSWRSDANFFPGGTAGDGTSSGISPYSHYI